MSVTGKRYEIRCHSSAMAALRGGSGFLVTEIYIPDHDLSFNMHDDKLTVFRNKRYPPETILEDITIDENIMASLLEIMKLEDELLLAKNTNKLSISKCFAVDNV